MFLALGFVNFKIYTIAFDFTLPIFQVIKFFVVKQISYLLLFLFFIAACKKNDLTVPSVFTTDGIAALPSTVVILTSDKAIQKDTFRIQVGSTPVTVVKLDSFHLGLMVPVLPAGTYNVNMRNAGGQDSLALTISPYTTIANADVFTEQFTSRVGLLADSIEKNAITDATLAKELGMVRQLNAQIQKNWLLLTAQQKQSVAYFIQNISFATTPLSKWNVDTAYVLQRVSQSADPYQMLQSALNAAVENNKLSTPIFEASGKIAKLWSTSGSPVYGLSYQVLAQLYVYQKMLARQQNKRAGTIAGIVSGDFITTDSSGTDAKPVAVVKGRSVSFRLKAKFRTLQQSDAALFSGKAGELYQQDATLAANDQLFRAGWDQMKLKFASLLSGVTESYVVYQSPLPTTAKYKTALVASDLISVVNVSNAKIVITSAVESNGNLKLTFTNPDSTVAEATPFTYQLRYSQAAVQQTADFTLKATFANYSSVTIGSQVWMNENLAVTKFRNGDNIPYVGWGPTWAALTTPAWCYYNNDPATIPVYGILYNWYAVNDPRGLAPAGWHVASDAEWETLITGIGGYPTGGGKLKAVSALWTTPNTGASNSTGFSALPGGVRITGGTYARLGQSGSWWCGDQYGTNGSWYRSLSNTSEAATRGGASKQDGYSVRCVRD